MQDVTISTARATVRRTRSARISRPAAASMSCRSLYVSVLRRHRVTMAVGLAATVLQSFAVLPIPILVRRGVDVAIPGHDRRGLAFVAFGIVALTAATGLLAVFAQQRVQAAVKDATARLRQRVADQVFRVDYAALGEVNPSETQERLLNDPARVEQWVTTIVRQMLPSVLTVVGLVVVLFRIDPALTLVTGVVAPLIVITTRVFRRSMERSIQASQTAYEALARSATVTIRAQSLIRSRGATWTERALLHERIEQMKTTSSRRILLAGLLSASQTTVVSLASAITLGVGGGAVMSGRITLGALLSFFASVALIRTPVTNLATLTPVFVEGRQSVERIDAFFASVRLGAPLVEVDTAGPAPHRLALDRVSYAYPGLGPQGERGALIVEDLSITLESGKVLALAGPNGAGKTTVMELLLGLLQPVRGSVLVDDCPVDQAAFERIRRHIGVAFQHTQFFPGTVRENLLYGRSWSTPDDLADAIATAEADAVVARIPGGLDGWIGGDGDRLSGGERQRLAIARALVGRPSIVVLDEPSNHLPVRLVERVVERLQGWDQPPAVLMISHDTGVLATADATFRLTERFVPDAAPAPLIVAS